MKNKKLSSTLIIALGVLLFAKASYMDAKAILAQHLIAKSWDTRIDNTAPSKPWSWADTWAVATIEVPRLKVKQYVMRDSSGESLAFGPGHLVGSGKLGHSGHGMISGHRDSHFDFMKDVRVNDKIIVTHYSGQRKIYTVNNLRLMDTRKEDLRLETYTDKLTLITCFPFESVVPNGPLRWIIEAV